MYSQFRPFLGPNPQMLLPEKDHDSGGPHQLRLFLTPSSPATTSEDHHHHHHHQLLSGILTPMSQDSTSSSTSSSPDDESRQIHRTEEAEPVQQPPLDDQQEAVAENDSPELAVKLPSTSEFINDDDDVKTPTSPRCRIPAVLSCPAAPRKPKSRPITTKRKLEEARRVLFVDLSSDEIESLFSPRAADLRSGGGVKRVRQ